ncbi:MAG: sigma-54 dependent transcriptional regulator [Proteobacteria bacterium]|nr:sigma-54 dependent transcriptional regulator [Pseudomonadota bacterium]MBU1455439.1 sigma-54 dependent transcriptional regulator [Pseudomonadota bacterium]
MTHKILLIEDDDRLRRILQLILLDAKYDVQTAADGQEGIDTWQKWRPDVVLTDLMMEPLNGIEVLGFGKHSDPQTPIIILTAFGTVETAVLAMKDGAFDYLTKPVDNLELLAIIAEALESRQPPAQDSKELIGSSAIMQKVRQNITRFASTDSSVLISGESGTGKELAARAIHQSSQHPEGPFIRVNCAAIPHELLESELFGHIQGAFTGATANREGAFSRADGGTIFLDEIGDLPLQLQPKLLHAVEEKMITPVGSGKTQKINVKILSATNRDLGKMLAEKTFREDLYYRLNTVHLHMPPIRQRDGDLTLLIDHFLGMFGKKFVKSQITLAPESMKLLHSFTWPGNVREMKNVIERAVLSCEGKTINPEHLPSSIQVARQVDRRKTVVVSTDLHDREQQLIASVLENCSYNQSEAARAMGISRNTLRYRIKKYGISKR